MTRRNTYVCTDPGAADHNVPLQNGKDGRYRPQVSPGGRALQSGGTSTNASCPCCSSSAATSPQRSTGGASTHSISGGAAPSERPRFPRGTASRSTFHGGQLRERRTATYNGPPASPSLSHDTTPLSHSRSRGSTNLFSKLTSRLTRRYAELLARELPVR